MKTMSNVDIFAICYELNELLSGARVDKSFQPTEDIIVIRFHISGKGRIDIVFQAGHRMHISQYPLDNPKIPPNFPMLLRKRLKGATVLSVKQHNFDRVVEIEFKKDVKYKLIVELFSKGNIILLDEESNIISPLKRRRLGHRDISSKKEYEFPAPRGINPLKFKKEELIKIFNESETDIIRTLARNNLGGKYSEEIILKTGLDKTKLANDLNQDEIELIYNSINDLFRPLKENKFSPMVIKDKDVIPLELKLYEDFEKNTFETFNEAADEFYSKNINETITKKQEKIWSKKVKKFTKRLSLQEETLRKFEDTIEKSTQKGDLLYANYKDIDSIIKVISDARSKNYSWNDISKIIKKAKKEGKEEVKTIESVDKMGNIVLKINNTNIQIDSNLSIPENAESYYEKSKKAKRKIKGTLIAIEKTKKQVEEMKFKKEIAMEQVETTKKRIKKELKWYEKLRWFISSEGHLVIGGRDTHTNDLIVKKYMDNNDIYMHSDIHGASSVIIKKSMGLFEEESMVEEIGEKTLKEAAIFSTSFSSSWKNGYGSGDAYWVYPNQVSKTPKSGEYLAKGAFIIKGNKNYLRGVNLKLAIGIIDYEGKRVMAAPVESMEKFTKDFVTIKPGFTKKEKIAKAILNKINKEDVLTLDDIIRVLPSGKCDFV